MWFILRPHNLFKFFLCGVIASVPKTDSLMWCCSGIWLVRTTFRRYYSRISLDYAVRINIVMSHEPRCFYLAPIEVSAAAAQLNTLNIIAFSVLLCSCFFPWLYFIEAQVSAGRVSLIVLEVYWQWMFVEYLTAICSLDAHLKQNSADQCFISCQWCLRLFLDITHLNAATVLLLCTLSSIAQKTVYLVKRHSSQYMIWMF